MAWERAGWAASPADRSKTSSSVSSMSGNTKVLRAMLFALAKRREPDVFECCGITALIDISNGLQDFQFLDLLLG